MLLYCMTEPDAPLEGLPQGVHEATLQSLEGGGLRCVYSRVEELTAEPEAFRADALRFHAVLRVMLDRSTLVPFRFPTLLENDREIHEFVVAHAPAYIEDLRRLRGKIQMEVRITPAAVSPAPQSGKEYMNAHLAEARALTAHAGAVFEAAREFITDWRVRHEVRGLRCYALVPREHVSAFEERIRKLSPVEGASILVSGPWPPNEFLHVRNP